MEQQNQVTHMKAVCWFFFIYHMSSPLNILRLGSKFWVPLDQGVDKAFCDYLWECVQGKFAANARIMVFFDFRLEINYQHIAYAVDSQWNHHHRHHKSYLIDLEDEGCLRLMKDLKIWHNFQQVACLTSILYKVVPSVWPRWLWTWQYVKSLLDFRKILDKQDSFIWGNTLLPGNYPPKS